jgi:hypothetical protein
MIEWLMDTRLLKNLPQYSHYFVSLYDCFLCFIKLSLSTGLGYFLTISLLDFIPFDFILFKDEFVCFSN